MNKNYTIATISELEALTDVSELKALIREHGSDSDLKHLELMERYHMDDVSKLQTILHCTRWFVEKRTEETMSAIRQQYAQHAQQMEQKLILRNEELLTSLLGDMVSDRKTLHDMFEERLPK